MTAPERNSLIRIYDRENAIVGTAFLVSERHALTCAHVVAEALGIAHDTFERPTEIFSLDFPFAERHQTFRARVVHWLPMSSSEEKQPDGGEDIALLEILGEVAHGCSVALFAHDNAKRGAAFHCIGFPTERGKPAEGRVKDFIQGDCAVIEDPQGRGYFIEAGFSGAPTWDEQQQVIGMIVRRDYGDEDSEHERTAYMIPASRLTPLVAKAALSLADKSAILICQVEPLPAVPDSFHLHAWLWQGNEVKERLTDTHQTGKPWHEIESEIQIIAAAVRSLYASLTVEIALPRNDFEREMARWELEQGETLLQHVAVALRCQKRFGARRQQLAREKNGESELQRRLREKKEGGARLVRFGDWQANSLSMRQQAQASASDLLFLLNAKHLPDDLNRDLCEQRKGLFIACGFKPDSAEDSAALCIALDYGVPLAVWFRELPEGALMDEPQLRITLRLDNGVTLGDLPRHLWDLQRAALAEQDRDNPLYHLTILHDDYERVPL